PGYLSHAASRIPQPRRLPDTSATPPPARIVCIHTTCDASMLPVAHPAPHPGVSEVCERLRADGVDVIRVSYPDLIGVDRGRDVLLEVLPGAMEHGLAFCRAVYHTSPMGD